LEIPSCILIFAIEQPNDDNVPNQVKNCPSNFKQYSCGFNKNPEGKGKILQVGTVAKLLKVTIFNNEKSPKIKNKIKIRIKTPDSETAISFF
jgi:hypothetical protein